MRDKKDSIIFLLSLVLTIQVLLFVGLAVWHVNTVSEIRETAEFAEGLALDSYNSNVYAHNYNVELQRDVWDIQGYLNHTMGYWPYYPYVTVPYSNKSVMD